MKFETQFKINLWKAWFEKGYALTHYIKYLIAFFGLASRDVTATMWIAGIYGISCFVIGYLWYRSGFFKAEIEVSNRYNMFVKEMRKKLINRKL